MTTPTKNNPNFTTAPIEILSDPELTPHDKVVWLVIKYRQGQNDNAWPSQDTIAKDAGGICEKTVQNSANRLKNHKPPLLEVTRPQKQGRGNYNRYRIIEPVKVVVNTTLLEKGGKSFRQKVVIDTDELDTKNYIQYSLTSDEVRLSELLLNLILENKPDYRFGKPAKRVDTVQRWAVHIDRLIRIDKKAPTHIEAVIRWAQQDDFWWPNILSTEKLRKQFDQLEIKMQGQSLKQPARKLDMVSKTQLDEIRQARTEGQNQFKGVQQNAVTV